MGLEWALWGLREGRMLEKVGGGEKQRRYSKSSTAYRYIVAASVPQSGLLDGIQGKASKGSRGHPRGRWWVGQAGMGHLLARMPGYSLMWNKLALARGLQK